MTGLTARQQALAPIAAITVTGDQDRLRGALSAGLDAGLTIAEIKEILVQLYAYAGFPRSLNALGAARVPAELLETFVSERLLYEIGEG